MSAHTKMNVYILLLSLITGSSNSQLTGCSGGWIKFTCKDDPHNDTLPISKTKITKNEDKSSTVVVRNINENDNLVSCGIPVTIGNCSSRMLDHITYNEAQTTIRCGYPSNSSSASTFLCKETSDYECEDIERINTKAKYSTNTTGLNITFTEVSTNDHGNYWCVAKGNNFNWTYRNVFVTVRSDFEDVLKDLEPGQDIQHSYNLAHKKKQKETKRTFFCKGKDPSMCQHLVNSTNQNHDKFSLIYNEINRNTIVTIKNVTEEDAGVYWFGTKTENGIRIFFRLELRKPSQGWTIRKKRIIIPIIVVTLVILLLAMSLTLLVMVLKYCKKNKHSSEQNKMENNIYEEIQDPNAGRTLSTVYASARGSKDSVHYASLDFDKVPKSTSPKTSASHCEYNVLFTKTPDRCSIASAGDPLNSKNKPSQ